MEWLKLQSWTKVLGTVLQYSYFSAISRSPLRTVNPFRNFIAVLPPSPHPIQSWNSETILDARVQHWLWGEGRGWTCVNWKTPQKCKCLKTFVHDCSLVMLLPVYHKLFNIILSLGNVPNIWCNCIITSIFKSGARNDRSNYRGICVSCCLRKLFFSILNQRLLGHAVSLNVFHKCQIGFWPKIEHQIMFLPYELI